MKKKIFSSMISLLLVFSLFLSEGYFVYAEGLDESDESSMTAEDTETDGELDIQADENDDAEGKSEQKKDDSLTKESESQQKTAGSQSKKAESEQKEEKSSEISEEPEKDEESETVEEEKSETEVSEGDTVSYTSGLHVIGEDDVQSSGEIGEAFSDLSGISTYASSNYDDDVETIQLSGTCNYTNAYKVLDLVNQERKSAGLSSLTMDKDLLNAAMQRAAECNVYFEHTRPSGYSCETVSSKLRGENVACGQTSASSVMSSWMSSSGHKSNILNSSYTTIGVGCFTQGDYIYWVQDFGTGTATSVSKPSNATKTFSVDVYSPFYQENGLFGLTVSSTSIKTGKSKTLTARMLNAQFPYDYADIKGSSLKWSSGTTSVATVSSSGKVTGKSVGSSKIKAKSNGGGLSASKTMKVSLATPSISKVSNVSSGVKVKWGKVTGASGYYIYRRTGSSGSYKKIATVKKGSTVTYTNKKSGSY